MEIPLCPRCGDDQIETTTLGYSGPPETDPNRATCRCCKHTGNLGDWYLLNRYDAAWRKHLREMTADFESLAFRWPYKRLADVGGEGEGEQGS